MKVDKIDVYKMKVDKVKEYPKYIFYLLRLYYALYI